MKKLKDIISKLSKEKIIIGACISVACIAIILSALLFVSALNETPTEEPRPTESETVRIETNRVTYPSDSPKSLAFESNGNGTCIVSSIGSYTGEELEIPEKSPLGDRVIGIASGAFEGCDQLLSVNIPYTVETIGDGVFKGCSSLVMISVDSSNGSFSSWGGILFSKNKSALICYPASRAGNTYLLNPNVKSISDYAFYGVKNLSRINYEGSAADFATIEIGEGNRLLSDIPITCNYYPSK